MTTYAVGDIQGCFRTLMKLLEKVEFDPKNDELWSAGDLINRGHNNLETLRFCQSLGNRFTGVLGNHDLHFLAVALGHQKIKGGDTFQDVLAASDLEEIITWLRKLALFHYDKHRKIGLVHAGVPPIWSIAKTLRRANEVEAVIRHDDLSHVYFSTMYGNKPNKWKKGLETSERWRVITNYLTRMRFCDAKGRLEFDSKANPNSPPKGYQPWFQIPAKRSKKSTILFGHWAALEGKTGSKKTIGLDTGCIWGGTMTLINVDDLNHQVSLKSQEK